MGIMKTELLDKKEALKAIASHAMGGDPQDTIMVKLDEIVMHIGVGIEEMPTVLKEEIEQAAILDFIEQMKSELRLPPLVWEYIDKMAIKKEYAVEQATDEPERD